METWVQSIGAAPIATAFFILCATVAFLARHIIAQQEARIEDHRNYLRESREMAAATNSALSSASQAMAAAGAGMASAREAMQIATAVMQRSER